MEGPTRAKVTEPRFLHICANLYTHTRTYPQPQRLAFADVDCESTCLRVLHCVVRPAIPRYTQKSLVHSTKGEARSFREPAGRTGEEKVLS